MSQDNLSQALKIVLADTYALYLKTQNYHWNVQGGSFLQLHSFFEEMYTELAGAIDELAETIRQLGQKAPGSFSKFAALTTLKEGDEDLSASDMVKDLLNDQSAIAESIEKALHVAQEIDDEVTIGFLTDRLAVHRKTKWMLKSLTA